MSKRLGHGRRPSIISTIAPHQLSTFTYLLQYYYCPWCRPFCMLISLFFPISYSPSFSGLTSYEYLIEIRPNAWSLCSMIGARPGGD